MTGAPRHRREQRREPPDHGETRAVGAILVNDGVFPSNEDRGYVSADHPPRGASRVLLGSEQLVMPTMVDQAIRVMGGAYPDLERNRDFITSVVVTRRSTSARRCATASRSSTRSRGAT